MALSFLEQMQQLLDPGYKPPPGSNAPPNAGNIQYAQGGGQLPPGMTIVNGVPTGSASMVGPGDRIVTDELGFQTVLGANGLSWRIGAPAASSEGGGGGGGGGGAPALALPESPKPQRIPFPHQAGASSLGAPNQTWDWLLQSLAAPGLLSPMLQQLGGYLAQNSTANSKGYSPMISQSNFGGLFGGQNTPPPFASGPSQPWLQAAFQNTPWQGSSPLNNLGSPTLSGSINPSGMYSGAQPQRGLPMMGGLGASGGKGK